MMFAVASEHGVMPCFGSASAYAQGEECPVSNGKTNKSAAHSTRPSAKKPSSRPSEKDSDVGTALRNIYQRTIDETVPQEMLDLLGKLG
ncbi:hypothetical protein [Sphingobium boeckii]|uniref:Anti-sigma factor NepR domain-containing protein n=1 Tax=Sphingobium boeckii TaxID=1082345 RepID=A0A7W9AIG9_9SPHN|nr:hypothetical protein [Sphingobium boeckii]MBB5686056.1 hypothetical protein [Sphingobium boeckii]